MGRRIASPFFLCCNLMKFNELKIEFRYIVSMFMAYVPTPINLSEIFPQYYHNYLIFVILIYNNQETTLNYAHSDCRKYWCG